MDLGAYSQIDRIEEIAKKSGIYVPRLRGYRLMSEENPVDVKGALSDAEISVYEDMMKSVPPFAPHSHISEYSWRTDRRKKKYLIMKRESETLADGMEIECTRTLGIRWNLIHGKRRKALKLALKEKRRRVVKQMETYNKYCGRKDVLYIHARIGGENWDYYGGQEIEKQPWFIERVDDSYDRTYCDIYAKIATEAGI